MSDDEEWDPLGIDEAGDGFGPSAAEQIAELVAEEKEGKPTSVRLSKNDIDSMIKSMHSRLAWHKPWETAPNAAVDTKWHELTYDTSNWQHHDVLMNVGEGIAYIIFNRGNENNTMQDTLGCGINDAIMSLHQRPDIRLAVWTGEGRMYCAGGDPKSWQALAAAATDGTYTGDGTVGVRVPMKPNSPEVDANLSGISNRALQAGAFPDGVVNVGRLCAAKQWHTWAMLPQFTICLANGSAMGGGVGCVACCDYVISVKKAYFVLSEVKIGVIPATISPYVISKIGIANSKRLFCCAENLTAEGAKKIGLVQEVVDTMREGHKRVQDICKVMSECGSSGVVASKRMVTSVNGAILGGCLINYTCGVQSEGLMTEDAKNGLEAKAKGQKPPWVSTPMGYPEGQWPENAVGLGKGKKE